MTPHYPDGLTPEDITALQRAVNEELRSEGYPLPNWPDPDEPGTEAA